MPSPPRVMAKSTTRVYSSMRVLDGIVKTELPRFNSEATCSSTITFNPCDLSHLNVFRNAFVVD